MTGSVYHWAFDKLLTPTIAYPSMCGSVSQKWGSVSSSEVTQLRYDRETPTPAYSMFNIT